MNAQSHRRRRRLPPAGVWLYLGLLAVAVVALAILARTTWQRGQEIEALRAEVTALRDERGATEAQIAALEDRLATLEASDPAQQLAALRQAVETADDSAELDTLRATLAGLQSQVGGFRASLDELAARIEAMSEGAEGQAEQSLPPEAYLKVARQRQTHNLSCESSAASMVAQYHGLPLTEAEALSALPLNDNPHLGFRGNVDGPTGGIVDYGVYADPVLEVLNAQGLRATRIDGGVAGIQAAIARGNPVIAWVTYNTLPSTPVTQTVGGEEVVLVPNQHVVVVTGYDADGVWANDPWDGQEDFYPYADFERAMGYFGEMAIEVAAP